MKIYSLLSNGIEFKFLSLSVDSIGSYIYSCFIASPWFKRKINLTTMTDNIRRIFRLVIDIALFL